MVDLGQLASDPTLRVEVSAGIEGFRHGRTTVSLDGSGHLVVSNGGRRVEDHLGAEGLRRAAHELAALDLERRHPEPTATEPDEPLVTLTVIRGGEELERRWWAWGEREREPGLDGLLEQWEQLARAASGGELPWAT